VIVDNERVGGASTSHAAVDQLHTDCVLVYERIDSDLADVPLEQQRRKNSKALERRRAFEEYLQKRQGLILRHVVSIMLTNDTTFGFFFS
jgi:hypothetical protein